MIDLKLQQHFGTVGDWPLDELIERITATAQGNPFYIEELINFMRDRGIHPDNPAALATLTLPDSLHSLILSRIDQLGEDEKITLKVGSVIGRVFKAALDLGQLSAGRHSRRRENASAAVESARSDAAGQARARA